MSIDYQRASYVVRSDYRVRVLTRLSQSAATPSTLAADTDVEITHVSRSLSEMRGEGYVELLVEEDTRKGRYYGLTEKGEETVSDLRDMGEVPA